jgi:hypothetical protein
MSLPGAMNEGLWGDDRENPLVRYESLKSLRETRTAVSYENGYRGDFLRCETKRSKQSLPNVVEINGFQNYLQSLISWNLRPFALVKLQHFLRLGCSVISTQ